MRQIFRSQRSIYCDSFWGSRRLLSETFLTVQGGAEAETTPGSRMHLSVRVRQTNLAGGIREQSTVVEKKASISYCAGGWTVVILLNYGSTEDFCHSAEFVYCPKTFVVRQKFSSMPQTCLLLLNLSITGWRRQNWPAYFCKAFVIILRNFCHVAWQTKPRLSSQIVVICRPSPCGTL